MVLKFVQIIVFISLAIFIGSNILYLQELNVERDRYDRKMLTSPNMDEFSKLSDNKYKVPKLEDLE